MSVHYKFKSALDYDTVTFDGLHISVKDLKNAIIQQKRIGKSTDFDLQVTNAQTKEVYEDENALIPKNTSLLIARIPIVSQGKKQWEGYGGDTTPPSKVDDGGPISRTADLSCLNAPEDEKIIAMMSQSTQDYDPSNYMKIRGANQMGPVPQNYRCYKCHQTGHWIKDCPLAQGGTETIEIKKSTGIPRSFMVPVEGPQVPGAMMTPNGSYAVPVLDHQAYNKIQTPAPVAEPKMEIPEDLVCSICSDLLSDAVMIPCCGNSFCDECIRSCLLESEDHECPDCHDKDISPGTLIPNRFLRNSVLNFKNTTGYVKKPVYRPKVETKSVEKKEEKAKESTPPPKADSTDAAKTDSEEKTVISEADSTEHKNEETAEATKDKGQDTLKSTTSSESIPEGPPGVSPKASPKRHHISNRVNYPRKESRHHKRDRPDRSPKKHHRRGKMSPNYSDSNQEDRPGTPTVDEPGSGSYSSDRVYNPPPGTIPSIVGGMHAMQGPPPTMPGPYPNAQPIGNFAPTQGPPPNFRLPPPGAAPYIQQPGFPGPPRPMYDANRLSGPPPNYNPSYGGSRPHHGRDYNRGRMRDRTPPGIIDDPLAAFNKMLREKDERERRIKARNNRRSYSRSRSRSRSYSRSPVRRMRSRTPRRRSSRSRSRSFSVSRSRSRSYSGGSLRGSPSYRHISPPPRRSPPPPLAPPLRRFRSPMRSPPRRHRDQEHDRDYSDRSYRDKERRDRDNRSRDRERDHRFYDGSNFDDRRGVAHGHQRNQWNPGPPPPREVPPQGYYPPPEGFNNRYPPREFQPAMPPVGVGMPPMHIPPQRRFDDIAPPGVEEPPVPGLENSPTFDRFMPKPEIKQEKLSPVRDERDRKEERERKDDRDRDRERDRKDDKRVAEKREDRHSDRRRRHERRSKTPDKHPKSPARKKSKSKERDSPDKHRKKRRDETHEEEREKKRDHSEDEKSRKSKDKKKKKDKKDSDKKKKKDKKDKHKEKKSKEEFKQVFPRAKEEEAEVSHSPEKQEAPVVEPEEKQMTPKVEEDKESTPDRIVTPKADLYDDGDEEIDTSVMENYTAAQEIVQVYEKEPIPIEEPEEGEISNTYEEEESEKDVLELHSTDIDLKTELDKNEMLAPMPEKSKWEVDEEGSYQSSPMDSSKSEYKLDKSGKVTNEVLKRAENAIFAKAINAIRPIEIKKISLERSKLYSGDREVEKADNNKIQITVPAAPEPREPRPAPPRLSVKERLGVKIEDLDRVVKVNRNRSRTLSPFSRRGDDGRNRGRIDSNRNRRSRSRHNRSGSRDRFRNRRDNRDNRRDDVRRNDRNDRSDNRSKNRDKERRDKSRSKTREVDRRKRTRSRSPSIDEKNKKKEKRHKKDKSKKHKEEDDSKESGKEQTEEPKLKSTTEKRKATIDESSFEPDYDLESESEKDDDKRGEVRKEEKETKVETKPETSSSESESSSSSEEERRKKKHKKHRKKKRKESSSSSSESESDSSDEDKHKKKKHKKKQKKKKKSKHK